MEKHMVTVVEAAAELGMRRQTLTAIADRNGVKITKKRIAKVEQVERRPLVMHVDLNALKAAIEKEEGESE